MGRLWLATYAVLLCSSAVLASITTKYQTTYSKKNLERAAELAVERAAEKAAERAVEKSLDSGNSSTITVTVKEAYENSMRTAEEAAAPGSESTRPEGIKMNDRQYQAPAEGEYKVTDSAEAAEAEQLGISKEEVNSSVENLEPGEAAEGSAEEDAAADAEEQMSLGSFESFREAADQTTESPAKDFDVSFGLDFGLDFADGFESTGEFGSKSSSSRKTETFSSSYSKPSEAGGHVDVDDADDAEVFGMYASGDDGSKWSSVKQQGWTRHRQLWDDSKRVSRESGWEKLDDIPESSSGGDNDDDGGDDDEDDEKKREKKSTDKPKRKLFKRMAGDYEAAESTNQVAVPLASLSLDPKAPALLYQLLQKELKYSTNNYSSKSPIPMRLYVTVPVPYLKARSSHSEEEVTHITPRPYHVTVRPKDVNEEIDDQGTAATKQPVKRSSHYGGRIYRSFSSRNNYQKSKKQSPRSLVKLTKHKVEFKSPTTTPLLDIARTKQKSSDSKKLS